MPDDARVQSRDAEVEAALEAWRDRDRDLPDEEIDRLWQAVWDALDFSWAGLADAGWGRGDGANKAQKLKRWRAPADFPVALPEDSPVDGAGNPTGTSCGTSSIGRKRGYRTQLTTSPGMTTCGARPVFRRPKRGQPPRRR